MRLRWMLLEGAYLDAIQPPILASSAGRQHRLRRNRRPSAKGLSTERAPLGAAIGAGVQGLSVFVPAARRSGFSTTEMPCRPEEWNKQLTAWPHGVPEFKLRLRLVATDEYCESLKERAARNGVADRIEFLEPVPFTDLVNRAADADIGYCVLEDYSPQRRFTAPNKFFEYAMAGLAVVCSDFAGTSQNWRSIRPLRVRRPL